jgi:hypothetical protein
VELVEQVVSESAVVDGGGLAWQEFAVHAKLYGRVARIRSNARCYGTLAVLGGTAGVLAMHASCVCQFRDTHIE